MYILEALQVFQQNNMVALVKHYVFDYNVPVHTLSCTSWVQHWKHLFLGPLRTGCGRNLPIGYNTAMLDCCCLSSCSGNSQGRAGQLGWRWRASCFRLTMPTHKKNCLQQTHLPHRRRTLVVILRPDQKSRSSAYTCLYTFPFPFRPLFHPCACRVDPCALYCLLLLNIKLHFSQPEGRKLWPDWSPEI